MFWLIVLVCVVVVAAAWFALRPQRDERLLGVWKTDPTDSASLRGSGVVEVRFTPEGGFSYRPIERPEKLAIAMSFRTKDGVVYFRDDTEVPWDELCAYELRGSKLILKLNLDGLESSTFVRTR